MSHHSEFEDKKQVNVYLPEDDDEFIEEIKAVTGTSKSDSVHVMIQFFKQTMSIDEFLALSDQLRLTGKIEQ